MAKVLTNNVGKVDGNTCNCLLQIARSSVHSFVHRREPYRPVPEKFPAPLQQCGSSFVTIRNNGKLRGCIGSTTGKYPLVIDVARNAAAAASDPRFAPVTVPELPDIRLEVSVLQPPQHFLFEDDRDLMARLLPDIHGVILCWQERRGLLLPQVWKRLPEPADFLRALCHKAGVSEQRLQDMPPSIAIYTFLVDSYKEDGFDSDE